MARQSAASFPFSPLLTLFIVFLFPACSDGGGGFTTGLPDPIASTITVSPTTATLDAVGATAQFSVEIRDQYGNSMSSLPVSWQSSDPSVAQVNSSSGLATALKNGSATIRAMAGALSGQATLTVEQVVAALSAEAGDGQTAFAGETLPVDPAVLASDSRGNPIPGMQVTFSVTEGGGTIGSASVTTDQGGIAGTSWTLGLTAGNQRLLASASGATVTFTAVGAVRPVNSVVIEPSAGVVNQGATIALLARPLAADGTELSREIEWSSDLPSVATVDTHGIVTGVAPGTATISATSEGVTGTAEITVQRPPVASVVVQPPTLSMTIGQQSQLTATVRDAAQNVLPDRSVAWASSNPAIVEVNAAGLVTAKGVGAVVISAESEGQVGMADVSVSQAAVATVTLTPASAVITAGQTLLVVAEVRDANGNRLAGRTVSWTSSDLSVINGYIQGDSALVVGGVPGTATLTASVDGVEGSALLTVIAASVDICTTIAGASLFANDGTYLGRLTNQYDAESIYNDFGTYGSPYSSLSIYNEFGVYGSPYSVQSPWNQYTVTPPVLFKNGTALAYFTVNPYLSPAVNPNYAEACGF